VRKDGEVGEVGRPKGSSRIERHPPKSHSIIRNKKQTNERIMERAATTTKTEKGSGVVPVTTLRTAFLKALRAELGRGITISEKKAYDRVARGKATLVYLSGNGKVRLDLGPSGKAGKLYVSDESEIPAAVAA
jgi:hypothetical protein